MKPVCLLETQHLINPSLKRNTTLFQSRRYLILRASFQYPSHHETDFERQSKRHTEVMVCIQRLPDKLLSGSLCMGIECRIRTNSSDPTSNIPGIGNSQVCRRACQNRRSEDKGKG